MKVVILINPFTSVEYYYNFFKRQSIEVIAFYTSKKLKRSGYVAAALNKVIFDKVIYSTDYDINSDYNSISEYLLDKELIYCFVCSEIDDFKYSEKLANKLMPKLSNDPLTSDLRMDKYYMHEKLAVDSVNSIVQSRITDLDIDKFDKKKPVVLKPCKETCSVRGVEFFDNISDLQNKKDLSLVGEDYIIQEGVQGNEYVVDTFSYNGKHTIIGIVRYVNNDITKILQATTTLNVPQNIDCLTRYIKEVLDSLDFKNGFCHSEVIIENNKPYLIESNPRLPGLKGFYPISYNYFYNQHHLKVFYETVMEGQDLSNQVLTHTKNHNIVFLLNNLNYDFNHINKDVLHKFESFNHIDIVQNEGEGTESFSRLNTIAFIFLINENLDKLHNDYNKLLEIQANGALFK